jgi:O-antigen ligase
MMNSDVTYPERATLDKVPGRRPMQVIGVKDPRWPGSLHLNGFFSFWLFFMLVTIAIPIIDLPIGGLSISTPVMGLMALRVMLEPRGVLGGYKRWILWAYIFWLMVLGSMLGNFLSGNDSNLVLDDALTMVRYAFWMLTFVIMNVITSLVTNKYMERIVVALGIATLALGILRLYEAIVFGRWGAWTGASILSQNAYGWQFSTFSPFVFYLVMNSKGWKRNLAIVGFVVLITAVAGNGSRSSWFTVALGMLVSAGLYSLSERAAIPRVAMILLVLIVVLAGVAATLPEDVIAPIMERFSTLEDVETEGSFGVREIMIQKGTKLFMLHPIMGVGPGRFREESVPLELPYHMADNSLPHFDRKSSHNSYISLLAENGLIGVVPFVILLVVLTARGPLAVLHLARENAAWAVPVYAGYIGMSIHLWSLSGLAGTAPWFVYGMLAGVLTRSALIRRQAAAKRQAS